jgi:hypothetical protein
MKLAMRGDGNSIIDIMACAPVTHHLKCRMDPSRLRLTHHDRDVENGSVYIQVFVKHSAALRCG